MASDQYWQAIQTRLADPVLGALASVPMTPAALTANGPAFAVTDALRFLVLGLPAEAHIVLEFVPRLEAFLADPSSLSGLPPHRHFESAAVLRDALLGGTWLATDIIRPALAQDAFEHLVALNQFWGGALTPLNLHSLMLLSVEAGAPERAIALYRQHEKRPVLVPKDLRFAGNPRAVLVACIGSPQSALAGMALERFRRKATEWERGPHPVPHVSLVCLARTLRACLSALGRSHSLPDLLPLLR